MGNSSAYAVTFQSLTQDVKNLITLHPSGVGTPGRPAGDPGPLLRSTVVLLHTAWENYVEQAAIEGLEFVLAQIGDDHTLLPSTLTTRLGNTKNAWSLAGSGWQAEARAMVQTCADRLNTPNVRNSNDLFDLAFGSSDVLHSVSWQRSSNQTVRRKIDNFVHDIRGEIVHKGTTPNKLGKTEVERWITFFDSLVTHLDEKIAEELAATTGARPW